MKTLSGNRHLLQVQELHESDDCAAVAIMEIEVALMRNQRDEELYCIEPEEKVGM
jgi:hypothetical protein